MTLTTRTALVCLDCDAVFLDTGIAFGVAVYACPHCSSRTFEALSRWLNRVEKKCAGT